MVTPQQNQVAKQCLIFHAVFFGRQRICSVMKLKSGKKTDHQFMFLSRDKQKNTFLRVPMAIFCNTNLKCQYIYRTSLGSSPNDLIVVYVDSWYSFQNEVFDLGNIKEPKLPNHQLK